MTLESQGRSPFQHETTEEQVQRVIDAGERAKDDTAQRLEHAADQAEASGSNVLHKASDKVREVAQELRSKDIGAVASDVRERASEVGTQAAERVDTAMSATGERMTDFAQTLREHAPQGKAGDIAQSTADVLERSGSYLQHADLNVVRNDLERLIRQHPIESLLVGAGIGFLLARATRRSRYG